MKNHDFQTKIVYYDDERNDEFSEAVIEPIKIDGKYKYVYKSLWKKITHIFWYRIIAIPVAYIFLKLKYHHKIVNRQVIKDNKGAFFLYGNHTNAIPDALIPTMVAMPKDVYVIVHPNNVSMPVLGKINPSLGAIPLPDDKEAAKNFLEAIKTRIEEGRCVSIYPEAHIWPFCTRIRNFPSDSFRYPIKHNTPVYCFTNTYQRHGKSNTPQMVTYVDGPFYKDDKLSAKEQREDLRNRVYNTMVTRSHNSNMEIVRYIKREREHD